MDQLASPAKMKRMVRYFPGLIGIRQRNPYSPEMIRFAVSQDIFCDHDGLFDRFMQQCGLLEISRKANLEMKTKNTIVEPWPMRLKQDATDTDFRRLCSSDFIGCERYVEWKKID